MEDDVSYNNVLNNPELVPPEEGVVEKSMGGVGEKNIVLTIIGKLPAETVQGQNNEDEEDEGEDAEEVLLNSKALSNSSITQVSDGADEVIVSPGSITPRTMARVVQNTQARFTDTDSEEEEGPDDEDNMAPEEDNNKGESSAVSAPTPVGEQDAAINTDVSEGEQGTDREDLVLLNEPAGLPKEKAPTVQPEPVIVDTDPLLLLKVKDIPYSVACEHQLDMNGGGGGGCCCHRRRRHQSPPQLKKHLQVSKQLLF